MLEVKISKTVGKRKRPFNLDVSFHIKEMEKTSVFFGASGSGKTMTLQCLAGLINPDSGFIKFDDRIIFSSAKNACVAPQKRNIGYMPQDYALFPHLTLLENVAYPTTGITGRFLSENQKKKARQLLEFFHLEKLEKNFPDELSGGQKQRASLARTLNANPSLLLLDEPFSALDPLLRKQMRMQLMQFLKKLSLPLIVITHDPEDVEAFGQTLILFAHGRTTQIDNFQEKRRAYPGVSDYLLSLQKSFSFSEAKPNL